MIKDLTALTALTASVNYGILQVSSITTCGEYKIVEAITLELEEAVYLTGIVDSSNIERLPFKEETKIYYLKDNHFLINTNGIYYHYKFNEKNEPLLKNSFEEYTKLDKDYLLIQSQNKKSIYNINKKETPFYSMLTDFHYSEKYHKDIASFFESIQTEDNRKIELCGMIDMDNNFTNNSIYNITDDEFIDIYSIDDYKNYLELIKKEKQKKSIKSLIRKTFDKIKIDF